MRREVLLLAFALALAGCGAGGDNKADKPDCPSLSTAHQVPGSTTTVDPRCVTGASEADGAGTTTPVAAAELWKGPVTGHGIYPGCSPTEPPVTGDISLSVDRNRGVTGHVTEDIGAYECGGIEVDPPPNTWEITGNKTSDAFALSVQGKPVRMDINDGRRASATIDTFGAGGYGATVTYSVECTNCE